MQDLEIILKQLGFTEYESKAFVTLIEYNTLSADKVSLLGKIPLPRVYDTMSSLVKRGLVMVAKTRPQKFQIIDPKSIFEILKEEEKNKMQEKLKKIDSITSQFSSLLSNIEQKEIFLTNQKTATLEKKVNINKVWEELQTNTRKEFLVFAGDLSWIEGKANIIKKMIKNGVQYKVLFSKSDNKTILNAKKAFKLKVQIRHNKNLGNLRAVITDGEKIYIIEKNLHEDETKYSSIILFNPSIAHVFKEYFNLLWNKGIPLERFINK